MHHADGNLDAISLSFKSVKLWKRVGENPVGVQGREMCANVVEHVEAEAKFAPTVHERD